MNSIAHNGQPVTFATQVIKGIEYVVFPGGEGPYDVAYGTHVNDISQTITFDALGNHTFGDAPFAVNATATSGLAVGFSIVSGPATISGSTVTLTGAGTVTVRASQAGDDVYSAAPDVDRSFTVSKATLTVTANSQTKTYGQTVTFAGTEFTTTGLVNGDTVTSVSLTSSGAGATAAVGGSPYAIVPSAAIGTGLGNYTIGYVSGALTVNPAALTVTADNQTKTYGAANPTLTVSYSGFVNGDTAASLTTAATASTPATAASAVGTYAITASSAASANYTIGYVSGTLTVNPAVLNGNGE